MAVTDRRGEHVIDDRRDPLALVPGEHVAPEQSVLQTATGEVGIAMEVDDDTLHQAVTFVVEGLAKVTRSERLARLCVRRYRCHGWSSRRLR